MKNFLINTIKTLLGKVKRKIFNLPHKFGYSLKLKSNIYKFTNKDSLPSTKKFDYIILGIGRIGSKAIQSFLNLHPEIFTISRKEIDKYIIGSKIDILQLQKKYRKKLDWLKSKKIKSVLVIHNNSGIYNNFMLSKFSKITDNAILFVRDPIENIKSHYKQGIYNSTKPSGYHLEQWDRVDLLNRNFEKSELEHLNKYLNNSIKNIKYYSKIKQTKRFFNDLKVVDFELLKDHNKIQNLFKLLEVNEFFHPSLDEPQNDLLQRYFRHNPFKFRIADSFEIKCRFSILRNYINSNDEKIYRKLISLNLPEEISLNKRLLKHVDVIFLEEDYQEILLEDRKFLNDKFIDEYQLISLFKNMIKKIKRVEVFFDRMKKKYEEQYLNRVFLNNKDKILYDIEKFIEIYPELNSYKKSIISKLKEVYD